jgi:broad specificity phosphatase PhoE
VPVRWDELLIDVEFRDIDTPLSELGVEQSRRSAAGSASLPASSERPQVVLCSPYVRARDTARLLLQEAGLAPGADVRLRVDERCAKRSSASWTG